MCSTVRQSTASEVCTAGGLRVTAPQLWWQHLGAAGAGRVRPVMEITLVVAASDPDKILAYTSPTWLTPPPSGLTTAGGGATRNMRVPGRCEP